MSLLLDLNPVSVTIDDEVYEINSDFRTSILFELMMQDEELSNSEKIAGALRLYYPIIPNNKNKAIERLLEFYKGNSEYNNKLNKRKNVNNTNPIYSYEYDGDYIYAAFMSQYNINLQSVKYLHWFEFKALFKSLNDTNMIVKIMQYRAKDLSKIEDKKERSFYSKMKKIYAIPVSKKEQEKQNEIEEALFNGGDVSKLL